MRAISNLTKPVAALLCIAGVALCRPSARAELRVPACTACLDPNVNDARVSERSGITSWKDPKDGNWLRGLYSFSENFMGSNGHLRRKALYGNQWIRTDAGQWLELTAASFSHDPTGRTDRLDRFMGLENGQFFLSQGGFVAGFTKYGEKFNRPATGKPPGDIVLPELPK